MKPFIFFLALLVCAQPLRADVAIAARNIRPGEVLVENDIIMIRGDAENGFDDAEQLLGLEAQIALYAGRAILNSHVGRAASIERNQLIEIVFSSAGLSMTTEGRALGRGAEGQRIRVMNLSSKTSIFGIIQRDGTVRVNK